MNYIRFRENAHSEIIDQSFETALANSGHAILSDARPQREFRRSSVCTTLGMALSGYEACSTGLKRFTLYSIIRACAGYKPHTIEQIV